MLSKNNTYLKKKKIANQAQRFGLRKLSIGTVSVLLGTLLFMGNSQASADTTTDTTSTDTEAKTASATTDLNASQVALSSTGSQAAASESAATASQATSSSTTATSQAATNSATAASDTTTDTTKTSTPATSTAAQSKTAVKATVTATPTAETNASIATAEASAATTANSQTTSDDAISAGGKITDEGKTKGLTDSDVTPGMSDANGASLVLDNSSKIPSGYKADPTEGRYTFGIVSLGGDFDPGTSKASGKDINNTTFNGENGKQYYFRFSTKAAASDGKYDDSTVYAQVVDASNNSIVWSNTLTPQADIKDILSTFALSYTTSTTNGLTTALVNLTNSIGTQYSKVIYSAAGDNSMGSTVHVTLPIASTITTEYIAKDASGAETELATYEETGRQGYTYTASGVRSFVGYDLIGSPSSAVGTLSRSPYNVGDVLERAQAQISDKYKIASVYVITKADGTAKMEMKIASVDASSNDYADESVWHTFLTTGELAPGEVATDGNYDVTSGDITYKNGSFLLYDSTYQPIGVKYLTAIGISSDDLTREKLGKYKGYMTVFGLNNRLAKGQEPVKYYYAPQGQVRVNYITNDGTVIQAPVTAYENSSNNTTYNVSGSTYKPETITVNGKTYRYVKSDKSKGTAGTTEVNGYTYNVTPSDETGRISSNNVNDVYFVYEQVTYHTDVETNNVTRTIEYYDSVTGEAIPADLEKTVTQTATLNRNKIYDDQNNFIGYGTVSADGSSYTIDDSWQVDDQTWTEQDSADLSDYGYTAPDRASVAAVTVDGNTTNVTEKVYYGHQTVPVTPEKPGTPGDPINPKGDVNYPDGVAKDDLTDTVTRTINYIDAKGNPVKGGPNGKETITQTVTFERTAIVDKVTGEILGYDTDNDGKVDTENADRAWTPLSAEFSEVKSADPKSLGFDNVDKSTVSTVMIVPGQADLKETVVYSNDPMVVAGTIQYIDVTTSVLLDEDVLPEGEVGTKINYTTADKIKSYESQGYELVLSDFTDGSQVYEKEGNDFVVKLKHKTQTITPNDPNPVTPGEPINPNDPNSPVYPMEVDHKNLIKAATQTIHYVGAGDKTPADKSQTKEDAFTRTVTIDKVTGKVLSTSDWQGSNTFGTEDTPVIDGYHADKKVAGGLTATVDDPDVEETVTYAPNGKLVPVDPNWTPIPGADTPTYTTDPNDPTKVLNPTVPSIDGWKPKDNQPGDSITPKGPGEDTEVPYVQVVSGTIKYVDDTTNATLDQSPLPEGEVGTKINYVTADKINDYEDQGYELVSNDFTDGSQVYEKVGNDFVVHLKHATKTITPEDPATPGQPINPKGNAEYPNGVAKDDLSDTVTRTINYVDADGNPVKGGPNGETTIKQTVTFKRTVIIDKVTGQLLGYDTNNDGQVDTTDAGRAWSPLHGEFDEVESKTPAEVGYLHVDRPKVNAYGVVPGDQDIVEKVVYSNDPMVVAGTIQYIDDTTGVLLDEDALPEGEVGTKISYTTADKIKNYENKGYELVSNNFTDGAQTYSKDGNDFVVHLKHKTQTITPNDPDLVTPGEPINPNDPNSPVYPPATARENLIKAATQTIHYVGAGDQTPADKVQTKEDAFTRTVTIDKVTGKVLSTSDWQGSETFGTENTPVVDGYHADKKTAGGLTATVADPNVEETVTYTPNAKIVPVDPNGNPIPGADTPTYPTDPTDPTKVVPNEPIPDVPGYTPVDPSPITPTDPGKDTPVPYTQNQYGLTEQFVDEDGNELSPSVSKGSSYKHGDAFDVTGDAKVINGYVLVKQENTKGTFGNGDETAKFIYKKLGRIIPVDPNGNPIPGADTPIYQNDPNDPSKVVPNEPTPTVPGYTPSTPSVTPADPTKDTPVPYTKNETPTNPSEPTTPANPTTPSQPTAPGTSTNPAAPSPAAPGQTTPANQQAASSTSKGKSATLPQTGNDQNETAAAAGLGLAGLSSLLALFGTRKKRRED